MPDTKLVERIRRKFRALRPAMDERLRRRWAATEARDLGRGGVTAVAAATGISRPTIYAGLHELDLPEEDRIEEETRVRRPGGGRRPLAETDAGLLAALDSLVDPLTHGDPESLLRWTCKSPRKLADELSRQDHPVSARTVATACRPTGRRGRAHPIPIGTSSSSS